MAQWLSLHARNAGGPGLIPGQGTTSRMHTTTKSLHAATKRSRMPQRRSCVMQLRPGTAKIN